MSARHKYSQYKVHRTSCPNQSSNSHPARRWVDEGKPVDARDNTQKTPLHHAAQWGQEETLDFLIECGAHVDAADFIEDTPLHFVRFGMADRDSSEF